MPAVLAEGFFDREDLSGMGAHGDFSRWDWREIAARGQPWQASSAGLSESV
jgi:hypothetical protein